MRWPGASQRPGFLRLVDELSLKNYPPYRLCRRVTWEGITSRRAQESEMFDGVTSRYAAGLSNISLRETPGTYFQFVWDKRAPVCRWEAASIEQGRRHKGIQGTFARECVVLDKDTGGRSLLVVEQVQLPFFGWAWDWLMPRNVHTCIWSTTKHNDVWRLSCWYCSLSVRR